MTREMNKPDWEQKYYWQRVDYDVYTAKQRKLDDWIKPFVNSVNERFKQCGKQ